jgi:hypothetical protein
MLGQAPVTYFRSTTAVLVPCEAIDEARNLPLPLPSTNRS